MLRRMTSVTLQQEGLVVRRKWPYPMSDIVQQGREGFRKNGRNPYPINSDRAREWERGYNQAYYENLARLENVNAV